MAQGVGELLWLNIILEDLKSSGKDQHDSNVTTSLQFAHLTIRYDMTEQSILRLTDTIKEKPGRINLHTLSGYTSLAC